MEDKKKQIIKISVFITSIFVILLSVSYAFINLTLQGEKKQVLTAGNLSLELKEDENAINISDALPMYDEVGVIQTPFTFRIINNTETTTAYTLKLVDITTGDKLDTSIVKYGLTKDGVTTKALLSTLTDGVIDTGTIGTNTIEYELRLWIDSSVKDNTSIKDKSLSYKLELIVEQKNEVVINSDALFYWNKDMGYLDTFAPDEEALSVMLDNVPFNYSDVLETKMNITYIDGTSESVFLTEDLLLYEVDEGISVIVISKGENENVLMVYNIDDSLSGSVPISSGVWSVDEVLKAQNIYSIEIVQEGLLFAWDTTSPVLETVLINEEEGYDPIYYYKYSEDILTKDQLLGATMIIGLADGTIQNTVLTEDKFGTSNYSGVIAAAGLVSVTEETTLDNGSTLSTGLWLPADSSTIISTKIVKNPIYTEEDILVDYVPDSTPLETSGDMIKISNRTGVTYNDVLWASYIYEEYNDKTLENPVVVHDTHIVNESNVSVSSDNVYAFDGGIVFVSKEITDGEATLSPGIWISTEFNELLTLLGTLNFKMIRETSGISVDTAYAIYSADDNSLRFYNNTDTVTVDGTYNGKTVTKLYTGIGLNDEQAPWVVDGTHASVTSVVVEEYILPIYMNRWFELRNCTSLDVTKINTKNITDMSNLFDVTGLNVSTFKIAGLDNWNTSNVSDMSGMFFTTGKSATTFDIGDLSEKIVVVNGKTYTAWDVSNVTTMYSMFASAGLNATYTLDLRSWNVAAANNYGGFNTNVSTKVLAPTWQW